MGGIKRDTGTVAKNGGEPMISDESAETKFLALKAAFAECSNDDAAALADLLIERGGETLLTERIAVHRSQTDTEPVFDAVPRSLAPELLPVPSFNTDLLPDALRSWVADIAQRGSFPVEYVAVAAMVTLASVVGRRCGIKPKRHDDWLVVPNLWGVIVGKPGVFKSPALSEALKPLSRLEVNARDTHKEAVADWELSVQVADARAKGAKADLANAAKKKRTDAELMELARQTATAPSDKPTCPRFYVNDATAEKLQELLGENPNGLLLVRDELSGWLKTLDKQGHENDRAFYLTAWIGTAGYTSDRIGRGTTYCDAACVSILGTIQPGVLSKHLRGATSGDTADGLMPRFQLMVYPDAAPRFVNVDRYPDTEAKNAAYSVFERLADLNPAGIGAAIEPDEPIPFLRFSPDAQTLFDAWRESLENRLRSDTETPALTEHLAKYRSLMPSLALLLHLAGNEHSTGSVSLDSANRAIAWCAFLEAHARRVYGAANDTPMEAAELLAARIKASLPNPFTPRDVVRKGWGGLSDTETVTRAVGVLEEHGWVSVVERKPEGGGRPSLDVYVNPAVRNPVLDKCFAFSTIENHECVISPTDKTDKTTRNRSFVGFVGRSIYESEKNDTFVALGAEADAELSAYTGENSFSPINER